MLTHRQGQYNTATDTQSYQDQERQPLCPHQHRMEQIHPHSTTPEGQLYMTQNLAHNTRQHYQAPTLNLFPKSFHFPTNSK